MGHLALMSVSSVSGKRGENEINGLRPRRTESLVLEMFWRRTVCLRLVTSIPFGKELSCFVE
jgi:hypothetical protein